MGSAEGLEVAVMKQSRLRGRCERDSTETMRVVAMGPEPWGMVRCGPEAGQPTLSGPVATGTARNAGVANEPLPLLARGRRLFWRIVKQMIERMDSIQLSGSNSVEARKDKLHGNGLKSRTCAG